MRKLYFIKSNWKEIIKPIKSNLYAIVQIQIFFLPLLLEKICKEKRSSEEIINQPSSSSWMGLWSDKRYIFILFSLSTEQSSFSRDYHRSITSSIIIHTSIIISMLFTCSFNTPGSKYFETGSKISIKAAKRSIN